MTLSVWSSVELRAISEQVNAEMPLEKGSNAGAKVMTKGDLATPAEEHGLKKAMCSVRLDYDMSHFLKHR
eukprot:702891-Karenia_brevis.AAC.1